ncbi:MAG: hypothetical protein OXC08_11825 [Thiotrichales bacterium]|nr:hypothetical protein [Thiotrichales bacterium]
MNVVGKLAEPKLHYRCTPDKDRRRDITLCAECLNLAVPNVYVSAGLIPWNKAARLKCAGCGTKG